MISLRPQAPTGKAVIRWLDVAGLAASANLSGRTTRYFFFFRASASLRAATFASI